MISYQSYLNLEIVENKKREILAGIRMPLIQYGDMLLDGNHRLEAYKQLGIKPSIRILTKDELKRFLFSNPENK
ncbi:hypothetical protein EPO66_03610 [bacterium]|nr:MAG: hypothetical protein EPO66_03610 [bacterium]